MVQVCIIVNDRGIGFVEEIPEEGGFLNLYGGEANCFDGWYKVDHVKIDFAARALVTATKESDLKDGEPICQLSDVIS